MNIGSITLIAALAAALAACDVRSTVQDSAPNPPTAAKSPLSTGGTPSSAELHFSGRVLERMSAGAYTYMLVEEEAATRWIVTLGRGARVGETVDVLSVVARDGFWSKRLGRSFDRVLFAIVRSAGAA